ncbi:MAG: NAD(P)H-dependent oxidoreductase [Pelagimonas sp.]|jgi:FMN-dependent NADH-azoreductase|nr:NAD(P)H-dependent oxidoreductase [Pelagimonas sp.]
MTQTLLRIDASARHAGSVTRDLADRIAEKLAPEQTLTRDLTSGLPLLSETWIGASFTPDDQRNDTQRAALELSDSLIAELQKADTLLIALPIYNFGIPAALKAWIDLIARAGVTFQYTENGPQGLLSGKRAIFAVASGGTEVDSPVDFATPYLRHVLNFVGITDVQVVRSDMLAVDADASAARAEADLAALAA